MIDGPRHGITSRELHRDPPLHRRAACCRTPPVLGPFVGSLGDKAGRLQLRAREIVIATQGDVQSERGPGLVGVELHRHTSDHSVRRFGRFQHRNQADQYRLFVVGRQTHGLAPQVIKGKADREAICKLLCCRARHDPMLHREAHPSRHLHTPQRRTLTWRRIPVLIWRSTVVRPDGHPSPALSDRGRGHAIRRLGRGSVGGRHPRSPRTMAPAALLVIVAHSKRTAVFVCRQGAGHFRAGAVPASDKCRVEPRGFRSARAISVFRAWFEAEHP